MSAIDDLKAEVANLVVHNDELQAGRIRELVGIVADELHQSYETAHGLRGQIQALSLEQFLARAALRDALANWTFDRHQGHTHTWHDREDWKERHAEMLKRVEGGG